MSHKLYASTQINQPLFESLLCKSHLFFSLLTATWLTIELKFVRNFMNLAVISHINELFSMTAHRNFICVKNVSDDKWAIRKSVKFSSKLFLGLCWMHDWATLWERSDYLLLIFIRQICRMLHWTLFCESSSFSSSWKNSKLSVLWTFFLSNLPFAKGNWLKRLLMLTTEKYPKSSNILQCGLKVKKLGKQWISWDWISELCCSFQRPNAYFL